MIHLYSVLQNKLASKLNASVGMERPLSPLCWVQLVISDCRPHVFFLRQHSKLLFLELFLETMLSCVLSARAAQHGRSSAHAVPYLRA